MKKTTLSKKLNVSRTTEVGPPTVNSRAVAPPTCSTHRPLVLLLVVLVCLMASAAQAQSVAGPMLGWVWSAANPSCTRPVGGSAGDVGGELNWRDFYDIACVVDGNTAKWSVQALDLYGILLIRNWAGSSSCSSCDSFGTCLCSGNSKALQTLSSTTVGLHATDASNPAQYWYAFPSWGGVSCPNSWRLVYSRYQGQCLYSSTDGYNSHANLILTTCPSTCPSTGGFLFYSRVGF